MINTTNPSGKTGEAQNRAYVRQDCWWQKWLSDLVGPCGFGPSSFAQQIEGNCLEPMVAGRLVTGTSSIHGSEWRPY